MTGLLARIGGMLVAPRRLLADMSPETGRHDGAALLGAYLLAVAVLPIGDVIADFWALRSLAAAPGLLRALLPALPWLLTAAALDWLLGPGRAHRAALCLAPLLVIDALAHLLTGLGLPLPGPSYLAPALGGLAALLLAARVRGAIPPTPAAPADLSPGTASSAPADLSPGTASPAPADLSPGTAPPAPADLSPGTAPPAPDDLSPGTAPPAPDDLSPGTASPAPAAHVPKDMPPRTPGRARLSQVVGGLVLALVAARALTDLKLLKDRWPTLAPVAVGDPLPEFAVPLLDGGALRSADLRGRPHLLIFWTTWCGVCDAEMPMYRALAERYAARGLAVVAVNADREGDVPALVRAHRDARGLPFPIALDDRSMVRRFRVEMFPHLVLIDAAGQIRRVHQGRSFERDLAAAIEAVLP
jgi:peroxiredoxin